MIQRENMVGSPPQTAIERLTEPVADSLRRRCEEGVARVLRRYDWRLLPREELARRAEAAMRDDGMADPWVAAVNVYCHCLYAACEGGEGPDRQERALLELQHYLFELSCRGNAGIPYDIRLELVNETLFRIWRRLASYHKPGALLAIAAMELRNVMRPWLARRRHDGRPAWQQDPASIEEVAEQADPQGADPLGALIADELVRRVHACFDATLRRYPRARQQLEAVWLKFIVGYDDAAISRYLNKPVESVHVLRSRGLARLRSEPSWQLLAQELGI